MVRGHRVAAATIALLAAAAAPQAGAQAVERGRDIVNGICIGCHGSPPTGGPETVLGDATRIVAAFDKRPPMASLRGVLTPADVSDAAEYLLSLEGELPNAVPAHDASDLWWNAAESGWGFGVNQHPSNNIFAVLYVYDAEGRPAWFSMSGGRWLDPTTFVGRLYATFGPGFQGPVFDPAGVSIRQVGAVRITFAARDAATLVYTIDQRLYTKSITRLSY